jgi:hypothetical protein
MRRRSAEPLSRPSMRFVPVKREDRQALLMAHKARAFPVRQQTRPAGPDREGVPLKARLWRDARASGCVRHPRPNRHPRCRAADHGGRTGRPARRRTQGAEPAGRPAARHPAQDRRPDSRHPRRRQGPLRPRSACTHEPGQRTNRGIVFLAIARESARSPPARAVAARPGTTGRARSCARKKPEADRDRPGQPHGAQGPCADEEGAEYRAAQDARPGRGITPTETARASRKDGT